MNWYPQPHPHINPNIPAGMPGMPDQSAMAIGEAALGLDRMNQIAFENQHMADAERLSREAVAAETGAVMHHIESQQRVLMHNQGSVFVEAAPQTVGVSHEGEARKRKPVGAFEKIVDSFRGVGEIKDKRGEEIAKFNMGDHLRCHKQDLDIFELLPIDLKLKYIDDTLLSPYLDAVQTASQLDKPDDSRLDHILNQYSSAFFKKQMKDCPAAVKNYGNSLYKVDNLAKDIPGFFQAMTNMIMKDTVIERRDEELSLLASSAGDFVNALAEIEKSPDVLKRIDQKESMRLLTIAFAGAYCISDPEKRAKAGISVAIDSLALPGSQRSINFSRKSMSVAHDLCSQDSPEKSAGYTLALAEELLAAGAHWSLVIQSVAKSININNQIQDKAEREAARELLNKRIDKMMRSDNLTDDAHWELLESIKSIPSR